MFDDHSHTQLVSVKQMELNKNKNHPRRLIDGKLTKFPISVDVKSLLNLKDEKQPMDDLGNSTQLYFKLLKSIVQVYLVLAVISLPTYYIFGRGLMRNSNPSILSMFSIGNLGQTQNQCIQNNLHLYNHTDIYCPMGTNISDII